jgi:hypothetical protein
MKNILTKLSVALGVSFMLSACSPLNRVTIGKNNVEGIKLAVDCNMDGALQSFKKGFDSETSDYRRISYQLAAAVHKELGHTEQVNETLTIFKNDKSLKDKDETTFMHEVECFQEYFTKERFEKTNKKTCQ